jgi:thiol:disulfide interchange protein
MASKPKAAAPLPHTPVRNKPTTKKPGRFLTVLVIASLAVVIAGILLLKARQQPAVTVPAAQGGSAATASSNPAPVAGPARPSLPADQLDQALDQGQPALVFIHSNTCQSCIDMMKVVGEVYPEFEQDLVLIDVNVYDEANAPLLHVLGLRYIPMVVVYNRAGKSAQNVGVMKPDALRSFLRQNALGG